MGFGLKVNQFLKTQKSQNKKIFEIEVPEIQLPPKQKSHSEELRKVLHDYKGKSKILTKLKEQNKLPLAKLSTVEKINKLRERFRSQVQEEETKLKKQIERKE